MSNQPSRLIKSLSEQEVSIACDKAKDLGLGQTIPNLKDPSQCVYLKYAANQIHYLLKNQIAHTYVRVVVPPIGFQSRTIFDRETVLGILRFCGVTRTSKYTRSLDTVTFLPVTGEYS